MHIKTNGSVGKEYSGTQMHRFQEKINPTANKYGTKKKGRNGFQYQYYLCRLKVQATQVSIPKIAGG